MKPYSKEFRGQVLAACDKGRSTRSLQRTLTWASPGFGVSSKSVENSTRPPRFCRGGVFRGGRHSRLPRISPMSLFQRKKTCQPVHMSKSPIAIGTPTSPVFPSRSRTARRSTTSCS